MGPQCAEPASTHLQETEPRHRRLASIAALLICLPSGQAALAGSPASSAPQSPPTALVADQDAAQRPGPREASLLHLAQGRAAVFSVDPVIAAPGINTPITMRLPDRIGEGADSARRLLMFRGLPEGCGLSSGFRTRNNWIVAVADASNLALYIPPQQRESFSVEVLLYLGENSNPVLQTMLVQMSPAVPTASSHPAHRSGPRGTASGTAVQTPPHGPAALSKEDENLFAQGGNHLRDGNIAFARVLFEELAARGSPQGAFALAQTYDPVVLHRLSVVGIQPDLDKARHWYRKAAELGNIPPVDIISSLKRERPQQ
jgi:hypothetical protein